MKFRKILSIVLSVLLFAGVVVLSACNKNNGGDNSSSKNSSSLSSSSAQTNPVKEDRSTYENGDVIGEILGMTLLEVEVLNETDGILSKLDGYLLGDLFSGLIKRAQGGNNLIDYSYFGYSRYTNNYWYSNRYDKKVHYVLNAILDYNLDGEEPINLTADDLATYGESKIIDLMGYANDQLMISIYSLNPVLNSIVNAKVKDFVKMCTNDSDSFVDGAKVVFSDNTLGEIGSTFGFEVPANKKNMKVPEFVNRYQGLKKENSEAIENQFKAESFLTSLSNSLQEEVIVISQTVKYDVSDILALEPTYSTITSTDLGFIKKLLLDALLGTLNIEQAQKDAVADILMNDRLKYFVSVYASVKNNPVIDGYTLKDIVSNFSNDSTKQAMAQKLESEKEKFVSNTIYAKTVADNSDKLMSDFAKASIEKNELEFIEINGKDFKNSDVLTFYNGKDTVPEKTISIFEPAYVMLAMKENLEVFGNTELGYGSDEKVVISLEQFLDNTLTYYVGGNVSTEGYLAICDSFYDSITVGEVLTFMAKMQ